MPKIAADISVLSSHFPWFTAARIPIKRPSTMAKRYANTAKRSVTPKALVKRAMTGRF